MRTPVNKFRVERSNCTGRFTIVKLPALRAAKNPLRRKSLMPEMHESTARRAAARSVTRRASGRMQQPHGGEPSGPGVGGFDGGAEIAAAVEEQRDAYKTSAARDYSQ